MIPFKIRKIYKILVVLCMLSTLVELCEGKDKDKDDKKDKKDRDKKKCGRKEVKGDVSEEHLLNYLSSKRPYHFDKHNQKSHPAPFPECEATKLWYFGRHGTRNPGKKDTLNMETVLPDIRNRIVEAYEICLGTLPKKKLRKLEDWSIKKNVTLSTESNLVKQGMKELKGIGSRYKKRFPKLFSSQFLKIRTTKSQRTEASARSFAHGVFGSDDIPESIFTTPTKSDPVLKFYETCKKWVDEVDENPQSTPELHDFEKSSVMNRTIARVSSRLGLSPQLTLEELTIIYTTCAFETAWEDGDASIWCAPFKLQDLKVMAYREDLDYYWKDGYGHKINYEQACAPLKDLVNYFRLNNSDSNNSKVQAHFSHSGAALKLLARLGLFQDPMPLQSKDFEDIKNTYNWRTSLIDMMATNLAFVLYDCPGTSGKTKEIGFFFQEKPQPLPACGGKWHCSLDQFESTFGNITSDCDLNKICN